MAGYTSAILIYNTKSGHSTTQKQQNIKAHFQACHMDLEIVEVPKPQFEIDEIISRGVSNGVDLIVAAGGDGTISLVSNALVGTSIPLGILPLGTGNLLAKELKIPMNLQKALNTITADNPHIIKLDTFHLNGHHFVLNLSVGVSPKIMASTPSAEKQRLGVIAYIIHFIQQILGLELHRFDIEYDHHRISTLASEILITNSRTIGIESLKWSNIVSLNDGKLDLFIFRARNVFDILELLISFFRSKEISPVIKYFQFKNYCRIETRTVMCTQADGDIIGQTPVEVYVNPLSLNIITGSSYIS
ncbi:MAG: YegS/Rv2252/BmrU family lipid kinase [Chloroflexota bacterium]|nr:YegS/Rv2252/BmrU family lipid kinase [Chloroflexota bacterium]